MPLLRRLSETGKYLRTKRSEGNTTQADTKPKPENHGTIGGVTSWVKSKVLPLFLSWSHPHRNYNKDECFFPFPKITFLIDKPGGLVCQICRETKFTLKSAAPDSSTFSIMPCGHAACSGCLTQWFDTKLRCPFCRLSMRYSRCSHAIPLRSLTDSSIQQLPRTLPDGGHIRDGCESCLQAKLLKEARPKLRVAESLFRVARRRYHDARQQDTADELLRRRQEFETIIPDVHVKVLTTCLTSW